MLEWEAGADNADRAFWGANLIASGTPDTPSRIAMGALPPTGQWVRLTVSAESLGLGGKKLTGMTFKTYGGQAWFDRSGKGSCTVSAPPPASPLSGSLTIWVDDALPTGAVAAGTWVWDTSNKATGLKSNTEPSVPGSHAHSFTGARTTITPGVGDSLVAYILPSSCDPPREIMMEWYDGSWEHRAFWGEDLIPLGTAGTASRHYMGAIPTPGLWTRVFVPASSVGLENHTLTGLSLRLYNGKTWWDTIGDASAGFGSFDRNPGPIVASVTAEYIDRSIAPTAISPSRRYSLYTPELQLMAETDFTTAAAPTVSNEYVYFGGQPLAQVDSTGVVHYYFNDHLGTPILTTNSSATIDWRVEREPYGSRYAVRVDRYQPLAFPGQEDDASSDRAYNIFRWYRAAWGRYTQADPIGIAREKNLYTYAFANPLTWIDPTGLASCGPLPDCTGLPCAACCSVRYQWSQCANQQSFRYSHIYELGATAAGALAGAAATRNLAGEVAGALVAGFFTYEYLHHLEIAAERAIEREYQNCVDQCRQRACVFPPQQPPPLWQQPAGPGM